MSLLLVTRRQTGTRRRRERIFVPKLECINVLDQFTVDVSTTGPQTTATNSRCSVRSSFSSTNIWSSPRTRSTMGLLFDLEYCIVKNNEDSKYYVLRTSSNPETVPRFVCDHVLSMSDGQSNDGLRSVGYPVVGTYTRIFYVFSTVKWRWKV